MTSVGHKLSLDVEIGENKVLSQNTKARTQLSQIRLFYFNHNENVMWKINILRKMKLWSFSWHFEPWNN